MEKIQFFLPGPSYVLEAVRQAMTKPMVGHRSAPFKNFYLSIAERLPKVLRTAGDGMVASGSSTLIMESAVISASQSDVLNLTNGAFSERWHSICQALSGRTADKVAFPWGEGVDPDVVRTALRRKKYEAVTVVHNETSTGAMSNHRRGRPRHPRGERRPGDRRRRLLPGRRAASRPTPGGSTSSSPAPRRRSRCRPGSPCSRCPSALASAPPRSRTAASTPTCSATATSTARAGNITTPAIPLLYALDVQLDHMLAEGMEARWARHERAAAPHRRVGGGPRLRLCLRAGRPLPHRELPAAARGGRPAGHRQAPRRPRLDHRRRLRRLEALDLPHRPHGRGPRDRPRSPAGRDRLHPRTSCSR